MNLKFKGLTISKDSFEEKYNITLSDIEWRAIVNSASKSWEENLDEFRLLAFKHIRNSMADIGYKPSLDGVNLVFKPIDED